MVRNTSKITIQFLGAAETVTGSKILISGLGKKILIDCGMFQGLKKLRLQNWQPLPVNISEIDLVLLTHGHLDHVGYLPRLVKAGFNKKIMASKPTLEVAKIILEDSAKIQEEDAEKANKGHYSKHHPALPLYDLRDVEKTIPLFQKQPINKWINIVEGIKVRFRYNGHILGATFIELEMAGKVFVFSGDIGRQKDLLLHPPEKPEKADAIFIESTYGDRLHPDDTEEKLISIINRTVQQNGTVIIPGFALERIQVIMFLLWKLKNKQLIPDVPIYMDSPMGKKILALFKRNPDWHKMKAGEYQDMVNGTILIEKMVETFKLAGQSHPKIIIAGSGMASGGRVLTYFQYYLNNPTATIVLAGFQAEGTRGRRMLDGEKQVKFFGKEYDINANIENIEGLSAHADQADLINWMSEIKKQPENIFLIHGEKKAAERLKNKIKEVYGWEAVIPKLNERIIVSG